MASRFKSRKLGRPEFSIPKILNWADSHHARTGKWPQIQSGPINDLLGETWRRVDNALRCGLRGLPGGSSLAQLLAARRNVRNQGQLPPLRPKQILAWAEAHRGRAGAWPTAESGPIPEAPGETWRAVDQALRVGVRGLPAGSSLARFLASRRGIRNIQQLASVTTRKVLAWADAHRRRTGAWPTASSGPIIDAPGETWSAVATALSAGRRGLPGGSSLAQLLAARRGVRNRKQLPPLRLKQIRTWARAHRRRAGAWPTAESGPVCDAAGETWKGVCAALRDGYRGLPGGQTLAGLLAGRPDAEESDGRALTIDQILAWADAHHKRTGSWPHARCGRVIDAPGETWRAVDQALRTSRRGLKGGWTLVRLIADRRGLRVRQYTPALRLQQILRWAEAHHRRTGAWPTPKSGPIPEAPGETWRGVDEALRNGSRGLSGHAGLARLLAKERGVRNRTSLPRLSFKRILDWAEAQFRRTDAWPNAESGSVTGAQGETWKGVDMALRHGHRGLPGGSSLAQLLAARHGIRNRTNLPRLTLKDIRAWALGYFRSNGTWPTRASGAITEAPGETWRGVDLALQFGYRGLRGGSSLPRLLR